MIHKAKYTAERRIQHNTKKKTRKDTENKKQKTKNKNQMILSMCGEMVGYRAIVNVMLLASECERLCTSVGQSGTKAWKANVQDISRSDSISETIEQHPLHFGEFHCSPSWANTLCRLLSTTSAPEALVWFPDPSTHKIRACAYYACACEKKGLVQNYICIP